MEAEHASGAYKGTWCPFGLDIPYTSVPITKGKVHLRVVHRHHPFLFRQRSPVRIDLTNSDDEVKIEPKTATRKVNPFERRFSD